MTLTHLYLDYIRRISVFTEKAKSTSNFEARNSLRRHALDCQLNAGYLAHLIALEGDHELETIDLQRLQDMASNMPCMNENPWYRATTVLESVLTPAISAQMHGT